MEFLPTGYLRNKFSELYGFATPSGIVLLKKNEKFPRLTEEEERFHAILMGNTTFGLLHTIFDSFDYDQEAFEARLDFYSREKSKKKKKRVGLGIYSSDSGILLIPNVDTIEKESLDYTFNRNIRTLMKQHVDNMYGNSTIVHEVTAKYLSFRYASHYYYEPKHIFELNKEFDIEKKALPQLDHICQLLGSPLEASDWFAATFMLLVGEISLSTGELTKLSEIETRKEIRMTLLEDRFWDSKTPNERFNFLIKEIPVSKMDEWHSRYKILGKTEAPFRNANYVDEITSFFRDAFTKVNATVDYYFDRKDMINQAVFLTAKIKYALLALNTSFIIDRRGSVIQESDGEVSGVIMSNYQYKNPFFADPTGVVFREPRFCQDDDAVELEFQEFISLLEKENPYSVILVPIPPKDESSPILLYAYPRRKTPGQPQHSSNEESMPSIIRTQLGASSVDLIENQLLTSRIIWLFRIIPDSGWTNYKATTRERYKGKGDIVFLDLVNEYSRDIDTSYTAFYEGKLSQSSRDYIDSSTQTYLGMIKLDKESKYIRIASVPYYVREVFSNHHENYERENIPQEDRSYDVELPPSQDAHFEAGLIAFEAAYLYDLLPYHLFNGYSQEDLWKTIARIFE